MISNYKKEALKSLESVIRFYEFLRQNPSVCDNSDEILERLSSLIFYVGVTVCPSDCLSQDEMVKCVKER